MMQAVLFRHCFAVFFSFLLSYYLIPLFIKAAQKMGLLDSPDGRIKVHETPTPHFGGLAIFIAFIATLAVSYPFANVILWLLLGSTLLLLVGLIDDLHILKPGQKFLGQVVAVVCFLRGGFSLKSVFFSSWINLFLSGFWMLSIVNAFNLVDVMDGLSSTIALVAGGSFFILALWFGQYALSLLLAAFLGAVFAFFLHNKPPANIYLGDAGAMFVGGFLASVPLLFNWGYFAHDAYYAPLIILAIPLLEVMALVLIRTMKGIPFYHGSPHHFSIYLQKKGWSKNGVLVFTACAGVALGSVAFLLSIRVLPLWAVICLGCFFMVGWSFIIFGEQKNIRPSVKAELKEHKTANVETVKQKTH